MVSLERCSERDSGGQPGREGSFAGVRRGRSRGGEEEENRDVQDTSLPGHWKGEAAKPWTPNEFSFSLL